MSVRKRFLIKRLLSWGVPAVLIVALIALALRPSPLAVDLAAVERGELAVTVEEEGQTRVRERYLVSAPVAGKLLRIALDPGDPVTAGETVLATFQPGDPAPLDARSRAEAEARVRAAEAGLERARAEQGRAAAELGFARAELERQGRLAAAELISGDRLEEAAMTAESRAQSARAARFAVASAEGELERTRAMLLDAGGKGRSGSLGEPIAIRSPVDGTVLRNLRESEAVVPAGEPLIEIGDARALEIVSDLLSADAVKVEPGQRVVIGEWGGERPLAGVVRRVEPYGFTKISALGVEEQRVNVLIDLVAGNGEWSGLGDGYRVEVAIVLWSADDVLKVPTSSLFRRGDGWAVWVADGGVAALRDVEIGKRNGLEAEVLSGLTEGEATILHPSDAIEEGVQVEPRTT